MPGGLLNLFTDASIQGDWVRTFDGVRWHTRRDRVGPAMGAWIGWHDCDSSARPSVAGQAFLGRQGTQRAEYLAAIHGLQAALAYSKVGATPQWIRIHLDNDTVANLLDGRWAAHSLKRHDDAAKELVSALEGLGIDFGVVHVSERHPQHKAAHRMSRGAWNQLFFETTWRPQAKPPPAPAEKASSSTRPGADVGFID